MKRMIVLLTFVLLLGYIASAQNNREKRLMLNEYVSPEELVSMSKTLQFDKAVMLFSDFSKKYKIKLLLMSATIKKQLALMLKTCTGIRHLKMYCGQIVCGMMNGKNFSMCIRPWIHKNWLAQVRERLPQAYPVRLLLLIRPGKCCCDSAI